MYLVKRLVKGQDLKKEIEDLIKENNISSAYVVSAVGCISNLHIRLAKGQTFLENEADYEIVSLNGTICNDGAHLHIAVSDKQGVTVGGHLCYNCIVNTTCELIISTVDGYSFSRKYDEETGYKELVVTKEN